ncbi:MAG: hypothetical protein HeimC3_14150 [Candidatus Heimdallarchaeota archaeon LC_3]|nr:MAG: hypothetical protein HeimC3_14150 [Candidatus Heimdallarchaeota archaeon LC_3]
MTILGRAINVTFMKIIGKESLTISQTSEFTPRTSIRNLTKLLVNSLNKKELPTKLLSAGV